MADGEGGKLVEFSLAATSAAADFDLIVAGEEWSGPMHAKAALGREPVGASLR